MSDLNIQSVINRAQTYINRSGSTTIDFARRCGYAYPTMRLFLTGRYTNMTPDTVRLATAVMDFIDAHPIEEDTFTKQMYETSAVTAMRAIFARLLAKPQAYMVYAPPGSGKTDICKFLIAEHNAKNDPIHHVVRVYCREKIRPRDLMRRIASKCGSEFGTSIERTIDNLRYDYRGKRVLLYFDEAQHLDITCFETVRELLDEQPRFSLCFCGSHELEKIFTRFAGTLEQLERRITDKITLPPVSREEAEGIMRSELSDMQVDTALLRQQIDLATISVRVAGKSQRYISIGRLMAAIDELRMMTALEKPAEASA